jgi:hypothetical protein
MASASPFYYTVLLVCNTLKNLSTLSEIRYPHLFELPLSQDVLTTSYAQLSNYYLKIKLSIMKRFLLLLFAFINLTLVSISQGTAETPCPFTYKSNQGGGGCEKLIPGTCTGTKVGVSTSITLTYATGVTIPGAPIIESIIDKNGPYTNYCGYTSEITGTNTARICFYTNTGQADNFFNQRNSITIKLYYRIPNTSTSDPNDSINTTSQFCLVQSSEEIPLPVSFKSFSAIRNQSAVAIKWITSTESNNKGFNVQRNINGTWETVSFVPSAVTDGNSSSDLTYSFTDVNNTKGVTQYRIQQVDIDGRSKVSEIRSVKGEAIATNMIIYPNPSETGRINVVFEDQGQKNVQVSDMTGRVVRTLKGISNNVSIEGLESGVYSIKVTDLSSSALRIEKVIIKKR